MHYHPICYYLRGLRLYYLLITVETSADKAASFVTQALESVGLSESACAYWLFGDTDIIIRVWAEEALIIDLEEEIDKELNRLEYTLQRLLVSSMETWYQREIESRTGWHSNLAPDSCLNFLKGEPSEELRYTCGPHDMRKVMRFFIFIREPSTKNKGLFKKLSDEAKSRVDPLFAAESRISLYSIYSKNFCGVMLKGETANFSKMAHYLVRFASEQKEQGRETTTYICSRNLKPEANAMVQRKGHSKRATLENLLLSEECNAATLGIGSETVKKERRRALDLFMSGIVGHLAYVFHYHAEWWPYIKDLRYLYKWIIFQDNEQLMAFLTRHYALCENELRELLKQTWVERQRAKRIARDRDADNTLRSFLLTKLIKEDVLGHDGPVRKSILDTLVPSERTLSAKQVSDAMREAVAKIGAEFPNKTIKGIRSIILGEHRKQTSQTEGEGPVFEHDGMGISERNMTMGAMASYLQEVVAAEIPSEADARLLTDFAKRLGECGLHRNRVVHGAVPQFFEMISDEPDNEEYGWQKPVFSFIGMRLLFPHAIHILKEKWKVKVAV